MARTAYKIRGRLPTRALFRSKGLPGRDSFQLGKQSRAEPARAVLQALYFKLLPVLSKGSRQGLCVK
jgi:hypothetical protein